MFASFFTTIYILRNFYTKNTMVMKTQTNTSKVTNIYNLIILDESGSMSSIYEQALSGANETIQTIRAAQASATDQKQFLTFVTFSSGNIESVRTIIDTMPIDKVKDLTSENFRPNGCTPLYDAMGWSLTRLENMVSDDDQVLVTIITDGMENSSYKYSGPAVFNIVKRLRAKGWTFVYIGANQDAVEVAKKMNIDNAMNFKATHEDTKRMWHDYRKSTSGYYEKVRHSRMKGEKVFEDKAFFNNGGERIATKRLRFFKLNNRWYADVPNHTLEENEMVSGSDDFLNACDKGTGKVMIEMSEHPTGRDLCHLRMINHNQFGATYSVYGINLGVQHLWICNVTHDVFGEHPKDIYIQEIR